MFQCFLDCGCAHLALTRLAMIKMSMITKLGIGAMHLHLVWIWLERHSQSLSGTRLRGLAVKQAQTQSAESVQQKHDDQHGDTFEHISVARL